MDITRRRLLGAAGALAATLPEDALRRLDAALAALGRDRRSPSAIAQDEPLWAEMQAAFPRDPAILNLNHGGVSPSPSMVQRAFRERADQGNELPPLRLWTEAKPHIETVRQRLGAAFGADPEEIAITRNATESLMAVQHGLGLRPGDEVVTTDQDYPRMLQCFEQRQRRDGIVLRQIELPVPCVDDDDVVRRFADAITPRTRLVLVSHVINLTGQILPVRAVSAMAKARGVAVLVDGAHAIGHFPFRIDEIGCDFYGAALHKWLFGPVGTGLLWIKKDRIRDVWPLFAAPPSMDGDIRKFEEIGTHPEAARLCLAEALDLQERIGLERKLARLCLLRDRWIRPLRGRKGFVLHTDTTPGRACALANFAFEGVEHGRMFGFLFDRRRILTAPIGHARCSGLRVSPSVCTSVAEIDRFVAAVEEGLGCGFLA